MKVDTVVGSSDDQVIEISRFDLEFFLFLRPLVNVAIGEGQTMALQRALEAIGVLRDALEGAEFHHGLVVAPGVFVVEER